MSAYLEALEATDGSNTELVEKGSETEARAVAAFKELFGHFSADRLKARVSELYAEDAFFRDTFTEFHAAQEIEDYFVRSAGAVDECVFDIQDVAESAGNYYFRWTMSLRMERYENHPPDISAGLSHVRFNKEGKIVFQQDYWDDVNLLGETPAGGSMIRFSVKPSDKQ